MEILYTALLVLHFVGIVAIGYGFFKELAKKTFGVNVAMLHGASTQLLTGVLLCIAYDDACAFLCFCGSTLFTFVMWSRLGNE